MSLKMNFKDKIFSNHTCHEYLKRQTIGCQALPCPETDDQMLQAFEPTHPPMVYPT